MWIAGPGQQKMWKELFDEIPSDKRYMLELALADTHEGWPLVFYAVQGTRVNIVDYCLRKGRDPNITTPHGIPVLPFAILTCNHESGLNIVKTILRYGADTTYLDFQRGSGGGKELPAWAHSCGPSIIRMLRLRTTKDVEQAIQTAVQQKEMLIPHIPTEAVIAWTPPDGATKRVITKFEINLMLEDTQFHKNSEHRMTIPTQELCDHIQPAAYQNNRQSGKQYYLQKLLSTRTSRPRLIVLNDVLEYAEIVKTSLRLLSDMWTAGHWTRGRQGATSWDLSDVHLLLITRQPERETSLSDSYRTLRRNPYIASFAPMIREAIYWPENAEPRDVGAAVTLAVERHRLPPTPSVTSAVGSPITPSRSAMPSPLLGGHGIDSLKEPLTAEFARLSLNSV